MLPGRPANCRPTQRGRGRTARQSVAVHDLLIEFPEGKVGWAQPIEQHASARRRPLIELSFLPEAQIHRQSRRRPPRVFGVHGCVADALCAQWVADLAKGQSGRVEAVWDLPARSQDVENLVGTGTEQEEVPELVVAEDQLEADQKIVPPPSQRIGRRRGRRRDRAAGAAITHPGRLL